jgi:hypothetical protein
MGGALILAVSIVFGVWIFRYISNALEKKPESLKYWGVLYFGDRGSGKTLHQADQVIQIVKYWQWLWKKYPKTRHGIILTNQVLSEDALKEIKKYVGDEKIYFHFDDGEEMRFCPREKCWRGEKKHMLHGAVVVLDDIATFLPADGWQFTPQWMRKQWTQAQHLGLHFVFNCQEPLAYDINARRATQLAYRFDKIIGSLRPDETAKEVKKIWGLYVRRKIKAKFLWQFGNLEPEQIAQFKEAEKAKEQMTKRPSPWRGAWSTTPHLITRKKSIRYDTLQDVKEYEPKGYIGAREYECIDPEHNHTDKKRETPPYTTFKKENHQLV